MPRRSIAPPTLSLLSTLALLACGDSGRESASDGSASTSTTAPPTSTTDLPTTTATGSESGGSMGATDSATTGLTTGEPSTGSSTGGGLGYCDQDPPPGFVGPFDAACQNEPQVGMFNPVVEWHKENFTLSPGHNQSASAPIVAQLTDDNADGKIDGMDMPDILNVMYDANNTGVIRVISGDGLTEHLAIVVPGGNRDEGIAAGDIDGDGTVEIVTGNDNGQQILAYEHDGTLKWTSPQLGGDAVGIYENYPSIVDMNADGKPEVVVGRVILNSAGSVVGQGMYGIGAPTSFQNSHGSNAFGVDLDGDGKGEVIVGNAVYRMDGSAVWWNNELDGFPGVADFNMDGFPEIVVISDSEARLQDAATGAVLWKQPIPAGRGGPPTIADYDGDGLPEVGVAGAGQYTVFDTDGAVLWSKATQDASSGITGSSVYDFEGDGVADVVYADEINLYVFAGNDGTTKLQFADHNSGTRQEFPVVADVDNDGEVEIVFVSENYDANMTVKGITVVGDMNHSWRPGRQIWNQHAYSITNVGDDGSIPAKAAPNWQTYNNFRSGDLSPADGLAAPDLVLKTPESCLNPCTGVNMTEVWVQLGNVGAAPLTAGADVEVYGTKMGVESLLTAVFVPDVLQPGEFAPAFGIPIDTADLEQIRLVAKPKETECKVDPDNEIVLMPPFCTAPG